MLVLRWPVHPERAPQRGPEQRRSGQPRPRPQEVTQMQDGRFPVELVNGVPVVTAPEEIDITNAPELGTALLEAAANRPGALVADMTRTRFCDSSGLHALLAAHKRAQAEGGELLLVIPSAAVLRIFAITAIDRMIPNFTSLDEALAHTSPNGSNGSRRLGDELEGSAAKTTGAAAQYGTSGLDEEAC
jgi:anti-sigma B factor antagonist